MSFVPMVNSTIGLGRKSKSRGLCPGCRARNGPRSVGFLRTESFTFLDRLHGQLGQLSVPEAVRDALVRLWWLRRQRPRKSSETAVASPAHVFYLLQKVLCQKLDPNWRELYRRVAAVLGQTVRASSAVECMNSVLRMHQSRHRTLTQGMLDLKRLYWNCRVFRGGKRKGRCPYEHMGLKLPSYDFWSLLQAEMATAFAEAKAKAKAKRVPSRLDVRSVKLGTCDLGRSLIKDTRCSGEPAPWHGLTSNNRARDLGICRAQAIAR